MQKKVLYLLNLLTIFPLLNANGPAHLDDLTVTNHAPNKDLRNLINIKISGYVRNSSFFDIRQTVDVQNGLTLLLPKHKDFDIDCQDKNRKGQFTMAGLDSRLRFHIDGPDVLNAHTHTVIEGDFGGTKNTINKFRLRHAFIQMDWKDKVTLLFGHSWHPMFIETCYPDTISFNNGLPIEAYGREPQTRLTIHLGPIDWMIATSAQLNGISTGPDGFDPKYARNSATPNIHTRLSGNHETQSWGFGLDYKRIVPRIATKTKFTVINENERLQTNESLGSLSAIAYYSFQLKEFNCCTKLIFGQDLSHLDSIGGYVVNCHNSDTDQRSYANINTLALWTDMFYKGTVAPGLFAGFIKNMGTSKAVITSITDPNNTQNIETTVYGLGTDIDLLVRVAPRIRWHIKPLVFGGEFEWTRAFYGTFDTSGKVINTIPASNFRFLFDVAYHF